MGISVWQALIVLAVVILLFGTSRLKNVGSDLGSALKGFKKAIKDEDKEIEKDDADFESLEKPAAKTDESTAGKSEHNTAQKQSSKD